MTEARAPRSGAAGSQPIRPPPGDPVVFVHGLARTSHMFWRMAPALRSAGMRPLRYRYPSTRRTIRDSAAAFSEFLRSIGPPETRVHFVGFSLGAILIRAALTGPLPFECGRIVMIGPPNAGAGFLRVRWVRRCARLCLGPAIDDLSEGKAFLRSLGVPKADIGVIAGTRRFFPLNPAAYINLFRPSAGDHDGTVEVARTRLEGMSDFATVDANHTVLCRHAEVIRLTRAFLANGRFAG